MNSTTTQTQLGSRWWKIDFHVHTPASNDYGHGNQGVLKSTTPEDIIQGAMARELDAIVVTDHNSGEWVDKLQKANQALQAKRERPAWYRDLVIFPGVEVSVAGGQNRIHVLALFNPGVGGNTIAGLLGKCGISENYGDDQKTTTKTSMEDTIRHIVEFGAIPILAHADKEKGYLHGVSCLPDNGKVFHGTCRVFAAELADLHAFDTHISPDVRKVMNSLAKVGGSDAHSPNEIGKFSSWVKMSSPSVASMRLALQSPEWSVKNQDENPNQEPNLVLQKLTITGMKHCGRIMDSPCEVLLNPHQTSLIGGRGSGKSTIVESLRVALSQDKALDPSLPKAQRRIDSFMERASRAGGVMLNSTKIELDLRRNDEHFKLFWSASDGSHRIQRRNGAEWIEDQGDPRERFSVIVLSQKQIEEIADNPFGLLGIIDKRIGKGDWDEKWQQAHTQFVQLRERERELQRRLQEEPALRAQLSDVESDLSQFEKRGDGEILKRYQRQTLQWNAIVEDNVFDALTSELRAIVGKFSLPDFPSHLFEENDSALVEQKSLHDSIAMELNQVRAQLETVIGQIDAIKASWVHRITESAWHHDVEDVTAKYKELAEEYAKKNSRLDMSVYNEWIEKRNSLLSRLKQVESVKTEFRSVQGQISEVFQRFLDLRKELLNLRRRFIESAIGGNQYVKMSVVPFGNIGDLESTYRELLALESGKYKDAILSDDKKSGILSGFSKWAEDANCDDNDLPWLIETLKNDTMAIVKGEKSTDGWLMRKLKGEYEQRPQSFDNLLSWFPEDNLRVKYARSDSSKDFVDLKQGSAGQKAAAILAFLLSNGDEPIIIDQPEDDLDNALIYDLIVKQLHESKNRRQVIVATHNPNIVVNGDSELVHSFHFKNGQVQIAHSGGLDDKDIREDICTIMEGGREAFTRRYKRMEIDQT